MSIFDTGERFADSYLSHVGVKGMRWGRRKDKGNSAIDGDKAGSKADDSEDFTRTASIAVKAKSGGLRSLSNKEIRDLVDRVNLEQNFARVNTPEAKKKSPISVGVGYVSKKIGKTADMTVDSILKTAVQIKVQDELKRKMATSPKASNQLMIFDYK